MRTFATIWILAWLAYATAVTATNTEIEHRQLAVAVLASLILCTIYLRWQ